MTLVHSRKILKSRSRIKELEVCWSKAMTDRSQNIYIWVLSPSSVPWWLSLTSLAHHQPRNSTWGSNHVISVFYVWRRTLETLVELGTSKSGSKNVHISSYWRITNKIMFRFQIQSYRNSYWISNYYCLLKEPTEKESLTLISWSTGLWMPRKEMAITWWTASDIDWIWRLRKAASPTLFEIPRPLSKEDRASTILCCNSLTNLTPPALLKYFVYFWRGEVPSHYSSRNLRNIIYSCWSTSLCPMELYWERTSWCGALLFVPFGTETRAKRAKYWTTSSTSKVSIATISRATASLPRFFQLKSASAA